MPEKQFNKVFSKRLRHYLKVNGITQLELAKKLGVGTTSVYNWCNGVKTPRMDKVDAMCDLFGCRRADLVEDNSSPEDETLKKGIRIPVLGSVPAGVPIDAIEDIIDYEEIDSVTASKGEYFGLKVKGSSMEPRICEGDILIVKRQDDCESGDIAIVMVNGNDATVKRLMKYADGIRLIPNNPAYEPIYFTNEEIIRKPVKIIGKVIENRQKY